MNVFTMPLEEIEAWRLEHEYSSLWHAVHTIEGTTQNTYVSYGGPFQRFKKSHPHVKSWVAAK